MSVLPSAGGSTASLNASLALVPDTGARTYEPFTREQLARLRADPAERRHALQPYSAIGATGHARRLRTELDAPPLQGG